MSRDEVGIRAADRLLQLADARSATKPFNVKRKSVSKQSSKGGSSGPKLSMQDFVRMDPGYTPDIEHLVFPSRKRNNPQQVAPSAHVPPPPTSKTRSRLAEMFALSRHLQQRSADRESTHKPRNLTINRSVDSVLLEPSRDNSRRGTTGSAADRRWAAEEQPVHSTTRLSPNNESDMATTRGPNVSVLHLRNSSEPWETSPTSVFANSTGSSRSYSSGRSNQSGPPILTKHQSLGSSNYNPHKCNQNNSRSDYPDRYLSGGGGSKCGNREISPVRWCDREVDGVYLGRSGWVQVQQRSFDDKPRISYVQEPNAMRRTGLKLAEYQHISNVKEFKEVKVKERPAYLALQNSGFERIARLHTPSPNLARSFSPPLLTPIISPPPAFQDRNNKGIKSRTFFGKTPVMTRSDALVDSDVSPPTSPKNLWKSNQMPQQRKPKIVSPLRIPQTKSLEDTSATRRLQFVQKSSSSSSSQSQNSSSMGFRSLDSYVPRYSAMPRLSENTDSSIDVYEDADDEDNNSSSLNVSLVSSKTLVNANVSNASNESIHRKISPSNRSRVPFRTQQIRRSPQGSDTKPTSPGSSSTSSAEFNARSPSSTALRRPTPTRQYFEDPRVRRSRSLQLPDRKIGPEQSHRVVVKIANDRNKQRVVTKEELNGEVLREAQVVTGFLYGSRSRAAAQALLMHRYNNRGGFETNKTPKDGYVYVVDAPNERQKVLQRGSTTPNLGDSPAYINASNVRKCCEFWPQCGQNSHVMRSSQSYPTHHRSLDADANSRKKRTQRVETNASKPKKPESDRRLSPSPRLSPNPRLSPQCMNPLKTVTTKFVVGSSSSSSDVYTAGAERVVKSVGGVSGGSTPLDEGVREVILTRPGSAPGVQNKTSFLDSQQRSMSLPKSFLSRKGGQFPWKRRGTESLSSSPGFRRRTPAETSQTAPVTPLHEGGSRGRRCPLDGATRRAKAASQPQLLVADSSAIIGRDNSRKWKNESMEATNPAKEHRKSLSANTAESVLQKFRKTFSLRFQKKGSKESCNSTDVGDVLSEILAAPSEEDLHQNAPPSSPPSGSQHESKENEQNEQKYRFGPLIWRSSKERKKLNKAARSIKCNSGDSGIQIEMAPGAGGVGGGGCDSSESHDTDPAGGDCCDLDSPPTMRRRAEGAPRTTRPHSDLLNQILVDKFKAELKSRTHNQHQAVRRTHSDLGGQRILQWDARTSYRRLLMSTPAPFRTRPQSPRKKPPDAPGGVQLRNPHYRRGQLRRSLSQPLDIDKLSPLMRTKTPGLKQTGSEDEHDNRATTSEDETMSDSESSIASLSDRKKSLELAMDEDVIILAEAVFDHVAIEAEELAFRAGAVIEVLETVNRDWWWGSAGGKTGWFPAAFVRLRVSQEDTVEDCLAAMASGRSVQTQVRRRTSVSLLSNDQVRTSVVRELVHTERDFVKVLQDVSEGYVSECTKRTDMFSAEQINAIFMNLEDILHFQTSFLKDLETCIEWDAPHKSCVGSCFIKHTQGFTQYSDYCNSHPMATATLQELYQFNNYSKFFEACRLMRGLIEIPLDGYLLTPVQRICKYPLQLAELLKYTKPEHPDYGNIKQALEAMRGVAVLINERKRRMESLEKIEAWQQRVEGWEGEDLIDLSTQLIHQGEVVRVTTGMWTSNILLFLFDHQLVYCKKDILKRSTYVYKGRICLDTSELIDVPDGKDTHLGVNVRHAIKLYSCVRDKWLLVCCRSLSDKQRWLKAFLDERKLVAQDKSDGLDFPASSRQLAKVAARCQRRPPRKLRSDKNYKRDSSYMGSTLQLNSANNSNSLGRKVGTWFTFGNNKKTRQHRDVS